MNDAPFYAWDCISISLKNKWDVYLIIKNENVMADFLKLLIYMTESIDGFRGTAIPLKKKLCHKEMKKQAKSSLN